MSRHSRQELMVYALLWAILFLAPILTSYFHMLHDGETTAFLWRDVFFVWRQYAVLFAVFLLHNFLLAPLLIERQRRVLYFSLVAALLALFTVVQCSNRPADRFLEPRGQGGPPPGERRLGPRDDADGFAPRQWEEPIGEPFADGDAADQAPSRPDGPGGEAKHRPMHAPGGEQMQPPTMLDQHDVVAFIVLVLMLGMNLGVKLYFRQQDDRRKMAQLEKQSLEQQLEYLRYQINPHFLMNTLNNIHALVDIDAERAKESIVELSKIMRFVLYEGAKQTVPLSRELAFTQDYIRLMRMRLTDRVPVSVSMPERVPDGQVPPLVLVTFVENAFKHGVSYRQPSFIDISVAIADGQLSFTCRNSKAPKTEGQQGGVGLRNVRQRLDLIYGQRYTLRIDDQPETYNILLTIPLLS